MSEDTEVQVYGQTYRVKGENPERIKEVADFVDQKMQEFLGPHGRELSTRAAVLAALNIADEYIGFKKEIEELEAKLKEKTERILKLTETG